MSGRSVLLVVGEVAGGAGVHVAQLVRDLSAAGDEVTVAAPASVIERYELSRLGARVLTVGIADRPHPIEDLRTVRALRAAARGVEVVHAHGLRAAALACLAGSATVPIVATLHNAAPGGRVAAALFAVLLRVVARRAQVVLVVSPDLRPSLERLGAADVRDAVVAAPGLPHAARPRAELRSELGDPASLVVTVGRLAPQKDLPTLLSAAGDLPAGALVVVAGDGPLRPQLQERIDRERLPVRLLGHRSDVPDLLRAADVVVSAAAWEGQPIWLQEALAAGAPVVATDAGGTRGIVGDAGILVPPRDPAALGAALEAVLTDPDQRKRLADQAISRARELPDERAALEAARAVHREVVEAAGA